MEKLAGDLLLVLKFVKLEILSTSFIDFHYEELGELRSRSLGLKGLLKYANNTCLTSVIVNFLILSATYKHMTIITVSSHNIILKPIQRKSIQWGHHNTLPGIIKC